jgi:CheY-like chemotaxis protein
MAQLYPTVSSRVSTRAGDYMPQHRRPTLLRPTQSFAFAASDPSAALASSLVIVIDDEPPIVDVVCQVLEDAGVQASSCPYGSQAAACIQSKHPRLVIIDVQMPGVDGIQLFEQLRADPTTASLPVIFLTANSHILQQRLPDYAARGAVLVPKPFKIAQLVAVVLAMLDQPRRP